MGACSSTGPKVNDAKSGKGGKGGADSDDFDAPPFVRFINPRNSRINLAESDEMKRIKVVGKHYEYDITYCYVSQKGYYPNALGKANQDSYVVYEDMMADKSCHVFGVFDGHGDVGDYCSHFAAEQFGTVLAKELRAAGGTKSLDGPNMNKLYQNTFVKTNRLLKQSPIGKYSTVYNMVHSTWYIYAATVILSFYYLLFSLRLSFSGFLCIFRHVGYVRWVREGSHVSYRQSASVMRTYFI